MNHQSFAEIDVQTLARMRREGEEFRIIDVREPWEAEICSLEGSQNIPIGSFLERAAEVPKDGKIVVVCHHGMRSAQVSTWLRGNGFEGAVNLAGGIDAWAREIDPSMPTY